MKIAIRTPNWIGDVILAMPAINNLKKNFPEAQIWLISSEWVKDLFVPDGSLSGIIPVSVSNVSGWKGLWGFAQKLKQENFDIGILLTNSFSSALVFYLARISQRWGYLRDGRGVFLTQGLRLNDLEDSCHQVNYYLKLLDGLGLQTYPPELILDVSPEEREQAQRDLSSLGLASHKPLVILNPGAYYGTAKRWPAERFAEVALKLQERKGADIIITGSPEEVETAEVIASSLERKPVVLAGKTSLRELLGFISQASLFITNDSGPMHMANALKVPVVAIFGPTDPRVTGPFHQPSTVLKKDVPCWPCFYQKCPYDHRCMRQISSEEVFQASEQYL